MGNKKKVLIIDDDQFFQKIYSTKIEMENFDVVIAENGEDGLKKWKEEKPDIVLLDLILPNMDGFEVLKIAKGNPDLKDTPVIIISNLGQSSDIDLGKELGADDYLVKARISFNNIIKKMKKYIDAK